MSYPPRRHFQAFIAEAIYRAMKRCRDGHALAGDRARATRLYARWQCLSNLDDLEAKRASGRRVPASATAPEGVPPRNRPEPVGVSRHARRARYATVMGCARGRRARYGVTVSGG